MAGVQPQGALEAVMRAVKDSGRMPSDMAYLDRAPDVEGDDASVTLPLLAIRPMYQVRLASFNSDFKKFTTDSNGNHTGRVFASEYRLDLELSIWTASGSSHDVNSLGNELRMALYEYDSTGPAQQFYRSDGSYIDAIWRVRLDEGQPSNDLSFTPSLRRWRQELTLWAYFEFDTTEDYVVDVAYPSDDSMTDEDGNDVVSNVSDTSDDEF